jgi:hypothetical protein
MTDELPPLPPDYADNPAKRLRAALEDNANKPQPSIGTAALSGVVLCVCLNKGLTPEHADLVWNRLRGTLPAVLPSALFKQIEDAASIYQDEVDTP